MDDITAKALALLHRPLRIVDVGAQSLGAHAYSSLVGLCELEIIGFDPLIDRLRERAENEPAPNTTLLPYAIGDGALHTFYVNSNDANSSLFALNLPWLRLFRRPREVHTVRTEQIETHRLDDVLPPEPIDFLKLDLEGGELMALRGAKRTLSETAVLHCEVSFSQSLVAQPLFSDVDPFIRFHGFQLIDLLLGPHYSFVVPSGQQSPDCLRWADAVYFRQSDDAAVKAVQALIAAAVYGKPTLAEYLLSS
jgi:FkbM family methyltransferase